VTEGAAPGRLTIAWSLDAQAGLRAIDRQTALDILHCIDRYLAARNGDVKKLKAPMAGFRLRCGDYRVFFKQAGERGISITGVRHRRDAYR
jgi:mRNA-degrading endonuclease RelE of RelBE toxin-antitoxin system